MSADADDLLERAAALEEAAEPTLDELKEELAARLAKLERWFPKGRPAPGSGDLSWYRLTVLNISALRRRIEDGDYREFPREESRDGEAVPAAEWESFLEDHPELAAPATFSDEEVLAALREAIEISEQPWSRGATSAARVMHVLSPAVWETRARVRPAVSRMGKRLAQLAREGKVVRLRQKWTRGRGRSAWSLPGLEIGEWWLKQFEIEERDDA